MRTLNIAGAAILPVFFATLPALAGYQDSAENGGHHMWGYGWGGMIFGPIIMIVVIAAVIVLVVLLVRWLGGVGPGAHRMVSPPPQGTTPLQILEERFARGEIDKDEFEERRRILSG
jgi:putative membrane protein